MTATAALADSKLGYQPMPQVSKAMLRGAARVAHHPRQCVVLSMRSPAPLSADSHLSSAAGLHYVSARAIVRSMARVVEQRWTDTQTDRVYERWSDGIWRYAAGSIVLRYPGGEGQVPGARDRTLTEAYKPRKMVDEEGTPIAVFIPVELVTRAGSELEWATKVGDWVGEGRTRKGVIVGLDEWQQHDIDVSALYAPELEAVSPLNKLAVAERIARLAELASEDAATARNHEVREAVRQGISRQAIARLLGVSVGRVGQLLGSGAADAPREKTGTASSVK
jgi:DNA-binding CsgD family transcriptional regulator